MGRRATASSARHSRMPASLDKQPSCSTARSCTATASARTDPPPLKWSVLRYGFGPEEDRDGEQEAQARGGRGQAAAGGRTGRAGAGGGGGDPRHRSDGGPLLPLAP